MANRIQSYRLVLSFILGAITIAWAIGIWAISVDPNPPTPTIATANGRSLPIDSIAHVAMYFTLVELLLLTSWTVKPAARNVWLHLVVIIVSTSYGAAIELYQGTVPNRTGSVLDSLLNGGGAVIAAALFAAVQTYIRSRRW